MPTDIQLLRSSTASARPVGGAPGEPYVNFVDGVFGVVDMAGVPIDFAWTGGPFVKIAGDTMTGTLTVEVPDAWQDAGVVLNSTPTGAAITTLMRVTKNAVGRPTSPICQKAWIWSCSSG